MRQWLLSSLLLAGLAGCAKDVPPATAKASAEASQPEVISPPDGQSEPVIEATEENTTNDSTPSDASNVSETNLVDETTSTTAQSGELKLDILDWDQTKAIVAAHPGKVVVFDLWATYCPPCLKELPGLVSLQEKFPNQVVCVSVCLDYEGDPEIPPSKIEPEIRQVLEKIKAHTIRNILLSTSTDDLFKVIEHQSMPVLYVFDQNGERVGMFPDLKDPVEPTYERDIVPLVEKLLAEPKP